MARKKPSKPGKATAAKRKRQAKRRAAEDYTIAFQAPPPSDPDVLARILPLPPSQTHHGSVLVQSPAHTIVDILEGDWADGERDGMLDLIAHWPFRITASGRSPGKGWTCLALLAYEGNFDLTQMAYAIANWERQNMFAWHPPTNVYVCSPELDGINSTTPEGLAAAEALFNRLDNESALDKARRRWSTPEIMVEHE